MSLIWWDIFRMTSSIDDVKSSLFWRAVIAELVGTFLFVLFGIGSTIIVGDAVSTSLEVTLCFVFGVSTSIWCIAHISGGHINPAVTAGMLVTRKISIVRGVLYVVGQCTGAVLGTAVVTTLKQDNTTMIGVTTLSEGVSDYQGFICEFFATFILVFSVFATVDDKRDDNPKATPTNIGVSIIPGALFAGKFTGGSLNPARSLGPALINGYWKHHWVYWIGPISGGIIAGLLYESVFSGNASLQKAKGYMLASKFDPTSFPSNKEKPERLLDESSL